GEERVPGHCMVRGALPTAPNGKLDRRALPAPGGQRPALATTFAAPASGLEATIAAIWQRVLGVERVGTRDNFFDLGGDSLSIIRVHSALQHECGREFPLVELFARPTVRALAAYLDQPGATAPALAHAAVRAERQGEALARLQRRPRAT